jgi:ATP-binding cassette, subfamily B, bacterial PglK
MVALAFSGAYGLIYVTMRHYLSRSGKDMVLANSERFQVAQEALGGIKEVKIFGREEAFFNRFTGPALRFARHQANNQVVGQMPRYLMEIVAFGGILIITLFLLKTHGNFGQILPFLAVYAMAGYRLIPAFQNFYLHLSHLRFTLPALHNVHLDMHEFESSDSSNKRTMQITVRPRKVISLEDIHFTYPAACMPVLKGFNLSIPVNSTIGLVGATGSGKTTVVDLILGLLNPDRGKLLVDDILITQDNVQAWQRSIGYIAQNIYLSDDTVAANIAFGVPFEEMDMDAVIRATQIAELHEFVSRGLPKGYDTFVGERGVRLSGGERQRIGIARALYHNPPVLIMDEATSSLDNVTENYIMQSIKKIKSKRTIILIAHRLGTVRDCDKIVFLEHGEIKGEGKYEELEKYNAKFREMVRVKIQ